MITIAKNYKSLIGQNCIKKCFQKEKNFPRWNLTGPKNFGENSSDDNFKWRNWTRWKYHAPNVMRLKCHAAKFPTVKFNEGKMSYDGISVCKISCGEIYRDENFRGKNVMRRNFCLRNFPRQTYHCENIFNHSKH